MQYPYSSQSGYPYNYPQPNTYPYPQQQNTTQPNPYRNQQMTSSTLNPPGTYLTSPYANTYSSAQQRQNQPTYQPPTMPNISQQPSFGVKSTSPYSTQQPTSPYSTQQSTYTAPQNPNYPPQQTYQGTYSTTQQYPSSQKEQILNQIEVNIFDLHPPAVPAWELSEQRLPQPPSFELQKKWYFPIIQSIKPQQFSQIIAWFNQVDKDHSGTLEIDEISTGSYPGCIRLSPQTALRFMRIFDTSRTGHLNIYEFIAIYRYLEICYALFNAYNGSGPEIIKSRLTGLGFVGTTQCTVDILSKIFSYNNVMDLNNWVACGAFVLQSRAIYQDLLDQGLMQKTENPQDATKILDSITLLIDK
ncbi:EF hand domain containing protein [Entamoeba histolytica KU27]|uniref:EF hand domain containing protein n=1 Tax=Entamoeba histolytica KU27 TaxID=885311 RepID=M2S9Q6_ENTHI|nr:EF hand domain containing protein [Entamoeba histolytica KU27]